MSAKLRIWLTVWFVCGLFLIVLGVFAPSLVALEAGIGSVMLSLAFATFSEEPRQ